MKKYLFALILCSFYCLNAKTGISSNNPIPKSTVTNTQYPDYYQTVEARYLSNANDWTSDGANGTIEISNNNLYVNFDPSWTYGQHIATGVIAYINIYPALPTIELGPIYGNGQETGYYAKIEDNNLIVYTPNNYSGVYYTSLYFGISIDLNCAKTWYKDTDGDGFGDPNSGAFTDCYQPNYGYVDNSLDCNDQNHTITQMQNWYLDADNDGYGNHLDQNPIASCQKPSFGNYVSNNLDCEDSNNTINPATVWYVDTDNDGFGDSDAAPTASCTKPPGNYVTNKLDSCPDEPNTSNNGCPVVVSINENYIRVISPTVRSTGVGGLLAGQKTEEITYFDGLGRPMQKIGIAAGGNGEDIITHIGYDPFGRQDKEYLPYAEASNTGIIRTGDIALETKNFYNKAKYESTTNPYSQKEFEASPLNRVLKQAAPGEDWKLGNGHEIRFDYQTNTNADQVRRFGVSFIGNNTEKPYLEDEGIYDPSQLYKTVTRDENWQANQIYPNDHTTEEFKDKEGRIILKRTFDAGKWHDTYYVYDDYGNLTYVLPPKIMTYANIIQLYKNQSSSGACVNVFQNGAGSANYELGEYNGILRFNFTANFNFGAILKSGKIADLNFNPKLPDMPLGDIIVKKADGSYSSGASVYTQNGGLYLNSTGVGIYDDIDGAPELDYSNGSSAVLSSFQAGFTPQTIDAAMLGDLCYQYRYDKRNRLVEKKLPGKEWEYIVYDKLDRPVLTQDTILKTQNKWLFTKYDAFNRPVYTGEYVNTSEISRISVQALADAGTILFETKQGTNTINGTTVYYSNNAFPNTANINLFTINYYDNYDFDLNGGSTATSYSITPITNAKGLATGSKVRILGTNDWITNVIYYDSKSRVVYNYSKNDYLATTSTLKSQLDFVGKVLETNSIHLRNSVTTTVVDAFTYDQAGRLTKQTQAINGAATPEVIVANTYDELGQLISKKVGGKTALELQTVDYAYNIRGWLKSINNPNNLGSDLFGFRINYNIPENPAYPYYSRPLYNGNISSTAWKTNNSNTILKHYGYGYDAMNRFKVANYAENNNYNYKFNELIYEYDRNGNIMRLGRLMENPNNTNNYIMIDYLTYTYANSNKLMKVDDSYKGISNGNEGFKDGSNSGDDYTYDANGNMTVDQNKSIINIDYNHLNLPTKITFNTGTIDYVYDATGIKQRKIVSTGTTTDYAGGFQYENNILQFFSHPEGYVAHNSGNFNYIYQYKDHLGNVRLSYRDVSQTATPSLQIVEENNYYPFGLKHKDNSVVNSTSASYKFKYNGKELQDELGLNMYDYGARNYDPALGRWMNIDPLAERYYGINPYAYVFNNPIELFDPNGMEVKYVRQEGQTRKEFREMKREFKRENRQLMKDSKTHRDNFNQLKDSKNVHNITFSRSGGSVTETVGDINRNGGNGTNMNIDLSQKGSENEFVVAHEVGHGVDIDNGVDSPIEMPSVSIKDNPNDVVQKTFDTNNQNKEVNERSASHTENIVRGEVSNSRGVTVPLRETYTLEVQYISPFSGKAGVKNKTINVKNESYDYYKKK